MRDDNSDVYIWYFQCTSAWLLADRSVASILPRQSKSKWKNEGRSELDRPVCSTGALSSVQSPWQPYKWKVLCSARETQGRFRDWDDIAPIFKCILAKLVVAYVRLGSDSGLYAPLPGWHTLFLHVFIGPFVKHDEKLMTERHSVFSEKYALW